MSTPVAYLKAVLVGRPKETRRLEHERLSKTLALAVFSSDALSSSAYATEEMLLVLIAGGSIALGYAVPLSLAITAVLGVVIFSYRQTVRAYPGGASAYIVASQNLGKYPGLLAASALLIDYVLTVAVSIAAGIAAVVSAFPAAYRWRVTISLAVIVVITLLNLRGVRESGTIFAVPTYAYIVLMGATVGWGMVRYFVLGDRSAPSAPVPAGEGLTLFLLLKAFSHGSTALTGVEAISDGVGAFREPVAKNAGATLVVMGSILGTLFVGLTILSRVYGVNGPTEDPHRTVVALIALKVFGQGPVFFAIQAATALILFLAANTSYADFPRLSAFLARDRFAPRQLMTRGDRLAFSNGIIALGALACLMIVVFQADQTRLIKLYVVGVFTSFSLSQFGMVMHWREHRDEERRWRRYAAINGVGASTTFFVLCIVLSTKFLEGAWMVVVAIPLVMLWLNTVHRHYRQAGILLRDPGRRPPRAGKHHILLLVGRPSREERRALAYAQLLRGTTLRCVHFARPGEAGIVTEWAQVLDRASTLEIVPTRGTLAREVRTYVMKFRARIDPSDFLTVVVPEVISPGVLGLVRSRVTFLVKASLLFTPGVVVTDVPFVAGREQSTFEGAVRHVAIVLVSGVHNATLQAIEYARSLEADELLALHVSVDPGESAKVVREWEAWSPGLSLTQIESEYRELARPVQDYVRTLTLDGSTVVTILIPEFIVEKLWHHLLHNQSAATLKRIFLTEPNVVVTSVTYRVAPRSPAERATRSPTPGDRR